MLSLVARLLEWLRSLFWKEEMELTLVGLQYSGKTTLLTVLASGQFTEDMIPTVGFNMRKITKGNVTIKFKKSLGDCECAGSCVLQIVIQDHALDGGPAKCLGPEGSVLSQKRILNASSAYSLELQNHVKRAYRGLHMVMRNQGFLLCGGRNFEARMGWLLCMCYVLIEKIVVLPLKLGSLILSSLRTQCGDEEDECCWLKILSRICDYLGFISIELSQVWDIGGQPRFRSMWERYCRGVNAVVYMVDAADLEKVEASKNELHSLIDKPQLHGIPVLVLGNKRDLPGALDEKQLIEKLNLSAIQDREICCYSISCKEKDNIGQEKGMKLRLSQQQFPGAMLPLCHPLLCMLRRVVLDGRDTAWVHIYSCYLRKPDLLVDLGSSVGLS
ncbi:hypothetical protein WISP_18364 [Willisornis vidua]|uniref:ARL8A protein n=145 Tax=Neognathae TaxID=8825 RepID=A0ABQ9DUM4_9PASS|nr:hypothetical protein WISP_18364 [Willisornis vidua]